MNKPQKIVVAVSLLLFILTLLSAPWTVSLLDQRSRPVQSPVWSPPDFGQARTLDIGTLLIQWVGIAVVGGASFMLFRKSA